MFAMQPQPQPQLHRVPTIPSVNLGMLPSKMGLQSSSTMPQLLSPPQLLPSSPMPARATVRTALPSNWPAALKPQHDFSPRSQGSTRLTEDGFIFSPGSAHTHRMSSDASLATGGSSSRVDTRVGPSSSSSPLISASGLLAHTASGLSASVLLSSDVSLHQPRSVQLPPAGISTTGGGKRHSVASGMLSKAPRTSRGSPSPRRFEGDLGMDKADKDTQGFLSKGQTAMRNLVMKLGLKYSLRVSQVGELTQLLDKEGFGTVEALRSLPQEVELRLGIPPRMADELRELMDPNHQTPMFGKTVSGSRSRSGSPIRQSRHSRCESPRTSSLGPRRRTPKRTSESIVLADAETQAQEPAAPAPGDLESRRFPSWITPFDGSPERQSVSDVAGGFPRTLRTYIPSNSPRSRGGSVSLSRPVTPREGRSIEHHQMRMEAARARQGEAIALEEKMFTGRVVRSYSSETLPDVQKAWRSSSKCRRTGLAVIPEASGRVLEGMANPTMCVEVCSEVALTVVGTPRATREAESAVTIATACPSSTERSTKPQRQWRPPTAVPEADSLGRHNQQLEGPIRQSTCPNFQSPTVAAEHKIWPPLAAPSSALRVYTPDDLRFANRYSDGFTSGAMAHKLAEGPVYGTTVHKRPTLVVPQRQEMPVDWL